MENPAHSALLTKREARDFLETNVLPDNFTERLIVQAELVRDVWPCTNCDGRKCMGCVMREYDHECSESQCDFCYQKGSHVSDMFYIETPCSAKAG